MHINDRLRMEVLRLGIELLNRRVRQTIGFCADVSAISDDAIDLIQIDNTGTVWKGKRIIGGPLLREAIAERKTTYEAAVEAAKLRGE
jgi:hypothetical protein